MLVTRFLAGTLVLVFAVTTVAPVLRAADCEDTVARHMVGQALLAAQFVALAERSGMKPGEITRC